jgi:dihydrolipoamide dehydrogenase
LTEEEAKSMDYDVKIGTFPFKGIGKAVVHGETEGFVKIIADSQTDDLLGVHMIGPQVTNLISEASLAFLLDATPWEMGETIHPHPSLSEVLYEAALAVDGKAIHF